MQPLQLDLLVIQGPPESARDHLAPDVTNALKPALLYADKVLLLSYEAFQVEQAIWLYENYDYPEAEIVHRARLENSPLLANEDAVRRFLANDHASHTIDRNGIADLGIAIRSGFIEPLDPLSGLRRSPTQEFAIRAVAEIHRNARALVFATPDAIKSVTNYLSLIGTREPGSSEYLGCFTDGLDAGKEAALSESLLHKLPSLSFVPMDEILSLRIELKPYLTRYRGAVAELASELPTLSIDDGSWQREVEGLWRERVAPEMDGLTEMLRDARFIRQFGISNIRNMRDVLIAGGATLFGFGAYSDPHPISIGAGFAASATAAAAHAYEQRRQLHEKVNRSRLFMLHYLGRRLPSGDPAK